jgi:membrane-associated protease RseP (regulator of RpoE activity)
MNLIDKTGKKYQKTLKFLSYVSITIGYLLMAGMLYLFGRIIYLYVAYPAVVKAIKIPPVTPLLPYIDKLVPSLGLPQFSFIYWIAILAIIAITHEFAHGIFMRRYGIKIKSTGFGFFPFFLPIFLAAFVEQDEKSMEKSSTFHQLSVLSAGTFANIITTIIGFALIIGFFALSFSPAGIHFNTYAYSAINMSGIDSVNGIEVMNPNYQSILNYSNDKGYNEIEINNKTFLATLNNLEGQEKNAADGYLILYDDSPAINSNLKGAVISVDGKETNSWDELGKVISEHSPEDEIHVITTEGDYKIKLGESPVQKGKAWLGIGVSGKTTPTIEGQRVIIPFVGKSLSNYKSNFGFAVFIFNFLEWLVLISFSVALVNMLPMGIFDGGRFFYLTIFSLTKSKRKAEKWFKGVTKFLLFLLILLMIFWVIGIA